MNRILLITEKNDHSKIVVTALNEAGIINSDTLIDMAHTWGTSWWHHTIPSHIPRANIPFTDDRPISIDNMKIRPRTEQYWDRLAHFDRTLANGLMRKSAADEEAQGRPMALFAQRWSEYDQIIMCPNHSPNGWGATSHFMRMIKKERELAELPVESFWNQPTHSVRPIIIREGIRKDTVLKAYYDKTKTDDPEIKALANYYDAKVTFDYLWNCNSAALFSECQKLSGVEKPQIISKYMLMALNILDRYQSPLGEKYSPSTIDVQSGLLGWRGTGKYRVQKQHASPSPLATLFYNPLENGSEEDQKTSIYQKGVGSPVSVPAILENLEELGLIKSANDLIQVSEKGQVFLSYCHPGAFDPDLPFRMDLWFRELSYGKIEKYIKTVFGRQKRYLSKMKNLNKTDI